uniref:Olfactory receptor family 5 subfamily AC member 2 n=1 Tax=Panthera tigris altaica TaxID=74533 RepID=A0A8C9KMQ8_PANTA
MSEGNKTLVTEFVLTELTERSWLQFHFFLMFLVIYIITMVGNVGLMALIWKDAHLYMPMYLLLGGLAFADACTSTSVTPKMLVNFLDKTAMISLAECITQFYFFASSATTECFLLVVMAYDRYVAICNPLLYPVIMSNRLCTQLIIISYAISFLHPLIHMSLLLRLTFCRIIHYFYSLIQISTLMTIIISYPHVLFDILKKKSEKGRSKAFSTCGVHLLSVSLYCGTLIFTYVQSASSLAEDQDKLYSLFYTIIISLLNPFIYSLRK